jgi:hypothetical protein
MAGMLTAESDQLAAGPFYRVYLIQNLRHSSPVGSFAIFSRSGRKTLARQSSVVACPLAPLCPIIFNALEEYKHLTGYDQRPAQYRFQAARLRPSSLELCPSWPIQQYNGHFAETQSYYAYKAEHRNRRRRYCWFRRTKETTQRSNCGAARNVEPERH